ncbi:hypothetical protein QTP88_012278 [Uroleucon formosanum]
MSLLIRYVDLKLCLLKENCICFVPVYECTGENLANTIIQKLKEIGLSLEFLRGQGYDSGANMSGKYHGVQARILNLQPKATYTHCASHHLTLIKAYFVELEEMLSALLESYVENLKFYGRIAVGPDFVDIVFQASTVLHNYRSLVGQQVREQVTQYFLSEVGSVAWQNNRI